MHKPTVSIGVPVYNGGAMIAECLTCIAEQTHRDFQVLISDNASTDETSDICAGFAARDSRFTHVRHEKTSDAPTNFFYARDQAPSSDLFMWRAHDDLSDETNLEKLVALFAKNEGVNLAVSEVNARKFNAQGELVRSRIRKLPHSLNTSKNPYALYDRLMHLHESSIYGLWKRTALVETLDPLWAFYPYGWASDHLTLLPLALDGTIRGDHSTQFIQRLRKNEDGAAGSHFVQEIALEQRQKAIEFFDAEVAKRRWSPLQKWALNRLRNPYINKRVHSRRRIDAGFKPKKT